MRISWKTPCIQDLLPDLNSLLGDFNCEVVVDKYGRATLSDFSGSSVSWDALAANGVVYLLNRTILHPLGYSLYLTDGVSPGFDVMEEDEFSYSAEERLRYDRALSSVLEEKYPISGISTTEGN
jgi:hypothetical protein